MSELTPERIAELRRLAEAATPGPWAFFPREQSLENPLGRREGVLSHRRNEGGAALGRMVIWDKGDDGNNDGNYIAACDPQTVLALCDLAARTLAAEGERDKLQAFKDWVHTYLDTHGVPYHPPGSHGAEGCRIGDRMDWLIAEWDRLTAENAQLRRDLDAAIDTNAHADLVRLLASNPGEAAVGLVQQLTSERDRLRDLTARLASALEAYRDDPAKADIEAVTVLALWRAYCERSKA